MSRRGRVALLLALAGLAAPVAPAAAVVPCGSSGDARTSAACFAIGREARALQRTVFKGYRASWQVSCPAHGGCPFTMDFRRRGEHAHCTGTARVSKAMRVRLVYGCIA